MQVTLNHSTPLHICSDSIRQCWQSQGKSDSKTITHGSNGYVEERTICGPADKDLIDRIGNKFKHASTLEHLTYNFTIEGISRACLQELSRHRMASPSVKSTRYTLKELKDEAKFTYMYVDSDGDPVISSTDGAFERARKYLVEVDGNIDISSLFALDRIAKKLRNGESSDKVKYLLPESYKTSLAWTINARSLQNFLSLRTSKSALWEIRDLANNIFQALPEDHQYLFKDSLCDS